LAELEPKLRIAETDTVKFQSQLEMMTSEKERLQTELKEANETHRVETKEASRARELGAREMMAAQGAVKDLEGVVKDLEAQIKAKEAGASEEVKQLKEQLRNAKLKADESKALSEAAYKQLSEAKDDLAQMEADLEDLEEKAKAGVGAAKESKSLDAQLKVYSKTKKNTFFVLLLIFVTRERRKL
jgi:DNA repair exonuclease SbcCD ATPase subunit